MWILGLKPFNKELTTFLRGGWRFTLINPPWREKREGVQNFSGATNLMSLKG